MDNTIYDDVYGRAWFCGVPDEAITLVINKLRKDTGRDLQLKVRKTTDADRVNKVPRYEKGDLFDKRG